MSLTLINEQKKRAYFKKIVTLFQIHTLSKVPLTFKREVKVKMYGLK